MLYINITKWIPDDAIAIKLGKNPEGNIINLPCEHIRIFDCVSHSKMCRILMHSVGYDDNGDAAPTVPMFKSRYKKRICKKHFIIFVQTRF